MENPSQHPDQKRPSPILATVVKMVMFSLIRLDPERFAFRESDELLDESIQALAEDIAVHGLTTPPLVKSQPDGTYLGVDCHRRVGAIALNIRQKIAGFTPDMQIPVHVLPDDASELDFVKRAISSNVQRQNLSDVGLIKAAVRMKQLGESTGEIARVLAKSETTVNRLLLLGLNPWWMAHVQEHNITATAATKLLKVASEEKRPDELQIAFENWLDDTIRAICDEDDRRRADDESSLTMSEKWPQRYLKSEQVETWLEQLKTGEPLGQPQFRYTAGVFRKSDGPRIVRIDSLAKAVDDLSFEETAKLAGRIADLDQELRQLLREKQAARQQGDRTASSSTEDRPSRRLWHEFGLQGLIDIADQGEPSIDPGAEVEDVADGTSPSDSPVELPSVLEEHLKQRREPS